MSGTIYAWSTVGAIAGTFVTGYFLIDWFGTARVLFILSLALMLMAFLLGKLWKNTPMLFVGSMVFFAGVVGIFAIGSWSGGYTMESKYYAIKVSAVYDQDDPEEKIIYKTLALDHLLHSSVNLNNPYWLYYPHEYIQAEFVLAADNRAPDRSPT